MLGHKSRDFKQHVGVSLDALVPQDNFYRQVDRCIDLSFVRDLAGEFYSKSIYGFASAALVIYTRTIWPIVGIHALIDLTSWLQAGTTLKTTGVTFGDVFITVVGGALAIGYGVLLLILANRPQRGLPIK